jgi:predicted HTH transcriptional regulator
MTRNRAIGKLVAKGESKMIEFKRSTEELREALQTLCAFANGSGGKVVIGVKPSGQIVGQQVSEQTLHEIAAARDRAARVTARVAARVTARVAARVTAKVSAKGERGGSREAGCWTA